MPRTATLYARLSDLSDESTSITRQLADLLENQNSKE